MLALPQVAGVAQAGVKAGDWARYDVSLNITGNKTLVKNFVALYSDYANTSYVSLNITAVYGTNVSLIQRIHRYDGTTVLTSSTLNVSLGVDPTNPPSVIMQNSSALSTISNATLFNVPRTINTLNVNSPPGNNSSALRYSWDEATGMLVSEVFTYVVDASDTNTGTFTYIFAISATSLWHYIPPKNQPGSTPPAQPFGLQFGEVYALAGVIGSIALGVVAYSLKRSPKTKGPIRSTARISRSASLESNRKKTPNN